MRDLLLLLAFLAIAGTAHAELTSNPEPFDTDVFSGGGWGFAGSGSSAGGWVGAGVGWATVNTSSGGNPGGYLNMGTNSGYIWNQYAAFAKNNPATPSINYSLSANVKNIQGNGNAILKLEFYGGFDETIPLGTNAIALTLVGSPFGNYSLNAVSPFGTNYVTVILGVEGDGSNGVNYGFDNVNLIPEPATIFLLGLSCFVLRKRRT